MKERLFLAQIGGINRSDKIENEKQSPVSPPLSAVPQQNNHTEQEDVLHFFFSFFET